MTFTGLTRLGSVLSRILYLNDLDLGACRIGSAATVAFCQAVDWEHTTLKRLNFRDNVIGRRGFAVLANCMAMAPSVQYLSIAGNPILHGVSSAKPGLRDDVVIMSTLKPLGSINRTNRSKTAPRRMALRRIKDYHLGDADTKFAKYTFFPTALSETTEVQVSAAASGTELEYEMVVKVDEGSEYTSRAVYILSSDEFNAACRAMSDEDLVGRIFCSMALQMAYDPQESVCVCAGSTPQSHDEVDVQ